jgi:anti-sigma factor RsiW
MADLSHQAVRELLGAYLVGALAADEQRLVADHLRTCPACQEELAVLAPLPALLRRAAQGGGAPPGSAPSEPGGAEVIPASEQTLVEVLSARCGRAVRDRRRRVLGRVAVVVALSLGAAGLAVGLVRAGTGKVGAHQAPVAASTRLRAPSRGGPALGTVQLVPKAWGTQVELVLRDEPAGTTTLRCVLVGPPGQVVAGTWLGGSHQAVVTMATAWRWRSIEQVEVLAGSRVIGLGQLGSTVH